MNEIDTGYYPVLESYDYSTCNLDTFTVKQSDLSFTDFFKNFMMKNLPCVIKNVACEWNCTKQWVEHDQIHYDLISERFGDLEAAVADCTNIQYNSHCKSNMKVKHFMEYMKNENYSTLLYLKDWHLRKLRPKDEFYLIPSYFAMDWLNEYATDKKEDDFMFVYIGPQGSWTPLHEDVYCSYSWSVNIAGRKEWILFPPGEEQKLKDKFGNLPLIFNTEDYDNVVYFKIVQEKGDAIFVPSGWHHQVVNKLNTISVNHNWINACNLHIVWQAIQKSLHMVEHEIEEFKDTAEFHSQCQLMLKSFFGMDFEVFITFLCYMANKRLRQLNGESRVCLGNYYLSNNTIKFDLKHILNVMNSIQSHPVFCNKHIPVTLENDFIETKNNIAQLFNNE